MSCTGNGYLTGNMLVDFPFEDGMFPAWEADSESSDSSDSYGRVFGDDDVRNADMAFRGCFVDASIYVSGRILEGGWPSVSSLSLSGDRISFYIRVNGRVSTVSAGATSERFPVVSGKADWGCYVVVMSSEGIRALSELCSSMSVHPVFPSSQNSSSSSSGTDGTCSIRFCAKCVTIRQGGLSSIRVYDGTGRIDEGPHFVLGDDIAIKPGNNILLSEPEDVENGVSISAVPGAGSGVVQCGCSAYENEQATIGGSDGHVRIFNGTCYDLEPGPLGTVDVDGETRVSRMLLIHSKCTACCTCEMYERIVNGRLAEISRTLRSARSKLSSLLSQYETRVKEFNRMVSSPRQSDISMTMTGMPIGSKLVPDTGTVKIRGKMERCSFVAIVRNSSYYSVNAKVTSLSGTDTIVEATAAWSYLDGKPRTQTSATSGGIVGSSFWLYPGRSLVITFVSVRNNLVRKVSQSTKYVGSISVQIDGIGTFSKSVEV